MAKPFIDVVEWNPGNSPIYAYKFPADNLSTSTQLIVAESQEALLFSKGRMMQKFGPGKHTLSTENIPIISSFYGIPFGGKNPFTAQVWYVNKLMPLNIDWEIDTIRHHDPDYKTMVPLTANGRYGLRVEDAERFLVKLMGTGSSFDAAMLTDHFKGEFYAKTKSTIARTMQQQQIGVKSIAAYLDVISGQLKLDMQVFWEEFGFVMLKFYVTGIDVNGSTPDGQAVLKAMTEQASQVITGRTWQQGRAFDVAQDAVNNTEMGGIMGVLMMTGGITGGGGGAMAGMGGAMMQPNSDPNLSSRASGQVGSPEARVHEVFCSNCSKRYQSNAKFCPSCGDIYRPCPKCGADNDKGATSCVSCGAALSNVVLHCDRCGADVAPGTAFCGACGNAMRKTCPQCKTEVSGQIAFCPNCGHKCK